MSDWQPIETAPKDRPLDLWGRISAAVAPRRWTDCEWKKPAGKMAEYASVGWCYGNQIVHPTHWMEPPDAPM